MFNERKNRENNSTRKFVGLLLYYFYITIFHELFSYRVNEIGPTVLIIPALELGLELYYCKPLL